MVAIRRVKLLIQFSFLAVSFATLLLFFHWSDVSELDALNLRRKDVDLSDGENGRSLTPDRERQFDVNEILKEADNHKYGKGNEESWETVFNKKAKHQVEKGNGFHDVKLGKRRRGEKSSSPDYEHRRLKGMQQESNQTTNMTTAEVSSAAVNMATEERSMHSGLQSHPTSSTSKPTNMMQAKSQDISLQTKLAEHLPTWRTFTWRADMLGALNVHIWHAWCGSTIHDLRRNKFFPLYPDVRITIKKFVIQHWEADYGQRVFGYIHPPVSGKYTFAISSDDSSELWLSTNGSPTNVRLIAWVGNRTSLSGIFKTNFAQFTKYRTQLSKPVFLHQGQKYFIEALHKQASSAEHLLVGWKVPGLNHFRHLSGTSISLFVNEKKAPLDVTQYAEYIPQDLPSHSHYQLSSIVLDPTVYKFGSDDGRDKAHKDKLVDEELISNLFPSCPYKPSYLVDFELRRYDGVNLIHDTAIYPDDNSELSHMRQYDKCVQRRLKDSYGNQLSSPPLHFVSNCSLYENGTINIFRSTRGFISLLLAKNALERQKAEEELHEMQVNSMDIQNLANSTEPAIKTMQGKESHALPSQDKENVLDIKRKTKRKHTEVVVKQVLGSSPISNQPQLKEDGYNNMRHTEKRESTLGASDRKKGQFSEKNVLDWSPDTEKPANDKHQHSQSGYERSTANGKSEHGRSHDHRSYGNDKSGHGKSHVGETHGDQMQTREGRAAPKQTKRRLLSHDEEGNDVSDPPPSETTLSQNSTHSTESYETRRVSRGTQYVQSHTAKTRRRNSRRGDQQVFKLSFTPVDNQDDILTRMNAAREYIRKMAAIVQRYNHPVNKRALADAVYKKFGIRMKIPNLVRVPDYIEWLFHQNRSKCGSDGNLLLNTDVATSVVNDYVRTLKQANDSLYSLKAIVNVEENHDIMNGDRYLIEVDLNVKGKNSSVRLSQYVYKKVGRTEFCLPEGFILNVHATVHIIIPVKNQGKWVQHFIDNMVELYQEAHDPHVNIIIVDFSSSDIDVLAALKRSPLKRYEVKKLKGAFQRAFGIHAGASLVKNPHDIIFMCDLHLQIPANLIDSIRKHCVEGKMAFAPIVTRLHCGFSPSLPFGFWELQGYGLFALFKSDYSRIGGMNYREFRTKWGGEDWELLDRVLLHKMEVERLRIPKFYHFYHSRKGMWGSRNTKFTLNSGHTFGHYDDEDDIITLYDEMKDED